MKPTLAFFASLLFGSLAFPGFASAQDLSTPPSGDFSIPLSQEIPSKYTNDWREDPGLWGSNPEMRRQAWILAAAGMDKVLGIINTTKVLQNLRTAQVKSGDLRGNFWWRWNDGRVTDRNAGFFVTLGLLTLVHTGEGQLNQAQRELLDTILRDAKYWFDAEAKKYGSMRYPNKFLGDVACMWLLAERFGTPTPEQHEILDSTLAYYRDNNWGWGEHMSDIYAPILQSELLAIYMWGPSLSPRQKQEVWDLFLEIVAIDDVFGSGPRVPAIRTYSATGSPSGSHYRQKMVPWSPNSSIGGWQPLQSMAYHNNIPALLPKKPEPSRHAQIDCYGGARALVTWTDKWRLGAMSRYQIMDGIDHRTYGLSWQTMPVAYWRNGGDWGFLQWESVVNGSSRTHPQPYSSSLTGASKSLADSEPGMIGMTYSVRRDDGYVVLRRIRRSSQWTSFKDRFRLIKSSTVPATRKNGEWNIMDLDYGSGGKLQLQFLPLVGQGKQTLAKNTYNGYDWEYSYGLAGEEFAALWIVLPLPGNSAPPAVSRSGGIVSLRWTDGDLRHLDVDLASSDPMKAMEVKVSKVNHHH
jgi:hypothetical protein